MPPKPLEQEDINGFAKRFQVELQTYLNERMSRSPVQTTDAKKLAQNSAQFVLRPGKRMRPYLAAMTARAFKVDEDVCIRLGIALELFHDFALVHDDIMDRSDERRGMPTMHKLYEAEHARKKWRGDAPHYGLSSAILSGDLLYSWADDAISTLHVNETTLRHVIKAFNVMKEEVILGQTLDATIAVLPKGISRKQLLDVLALKSGRYSIGRPILIGYALAGQDVDERTVLDVTEPLGVAFQIQDDILGTFGDPKKTGKSIDSDLREGKETILAWETRRRMEKEDDKKIWDRAFGNKDATQADLDAMRRIMSETGAYVYVKELAKQLMTKSIESAYQLPRISDFFISLAESLEEREV
ncbi:MAG: polyprenyl synthetase family protein [Patescibacteria group bacterium]